MLGAEHSVYKSYYYLYKPLWKAMSSFLQPHGLKPARPLCPWDFPGQNTGVGSHYFHALEKEMATHSSILVWRIPGMEEPGGLPSMGLHRVGHD